MTTTMRRSHADGRGTGEAGGRAALGVVVAGGVVAVAVGTTLAWPWTGAQGALVLAWAIWVASVIWGVTRRPVAVAFLGVQAWWALGVLIGASFAVADGYAEIGAWRFRGAIDRAVLLAVVADGALWFGAALARLGPRSARAAMVAGDGGPLAVAAAVGSIRVVPVGVARPRLDRWSAAFLLAGIAALVAYLVSAGADPGSLNVLTGSAAYGDLARSADGNVVKYFKTLTALAGVGVVVAAIRLARSHRSWAVPVAVGAAGALLLVSSGGRAWLAVPGVAAVLLWIKTSPHRLAHHPLRVLLAGGAALFVIAALIGGLRGQADTKEVDVGAFVVKEARGGVFAPTVGLLETVPDAHPSLGGSSYAAAVALPVPRAIWPDKPDNDLLSLQLAVFGKNIGASFGFHGELFANFGWAGVAAGSAAFGLVLEAVWLAFARTRRLSSAVLAAGALAVLAHLFTRDYLAAQLAGQFGFVVGLVVLARAFAAAPPAGTPA